MNRKLLIVGKYVLAMVIGIAIYQVACNAYSRIKFNHDIKALETSHDYEKLYRIQSDFLTRESTAYITYAVIGQSGIIGTLEARQAGIDAVLDNSSLEPSFSLSGAIVNAYSYERTHDPLEDIRDHSLAVYDYLLSRSLRVSLNLIVRRLSDEPSPEIVKKKISMLARFLFMDEQQLQQQAEQEGVEAIEPLFRERVLTLMSTEEQKTSRSPINSREDYEKRLQDFVDNK